jgi:hypothetical protein
MIVSLKWTSALGPLALAIGGGLALFSTQVACLGGCRQHTCSSDKNLDFSKVGDLHGTWKNEFRNTFAEFDDDSLPLSLYDHAMGCTSLQAFPLAFDEYNCDRYSQRIELMNALVEEGHFLLEYEIDAGGNMETMAFEGTLISPDVLKLRYHYSSTNHPDHMSSDEDLLTRSKPSQST